MRLILVHLSDIHITGDADAILSRGQQIVDGIKNLEYSPDACVVTVTGDIAYSGSEGQYLQALNLMDELTQGLGVSLSRNGAREVSVETVIVPGNHDCDFSGDQSIRDLVVERLSREITDAPADPMINACTAVQANFFNFVQSLHADRATQPSTSGERMAYELELIVGEERIQFICLNTAWLSRLNETQGKLYFPTSLLPDARPDSTLTVALFHHPYNWMEATSARSLRKRLEDVSDLILTGHEHDLEYRTVRNLEDQQTTYFEGGLLQDPTDSSVSSFNCFILDTQRRRYKFGEFVWVDNRYTLKRGTRGMEAGGLEWVEFEGNRISRRGSRFQLSQEMEGFLDDPGSPLFHRDRETVKLSDILVTPDLLRTSYELERAPDIKDGEGLIAEIDGKSLILISGDTQSGKTCFAKHLFRRFVDTGRVPILVDAGGSPPTGDRLHGFVEQRFAQQYDTHIDAYRQLDRERRVVIVDDLEKLKGRKRHRAEFLRRLMESSGTVIVLANEFELDVEEVVNVREPSRSTRILPITEFSHSATLSGIASSNGGWNYPKGVSLK